MKEITIDEFINKLISTNNVMMYNLANQWKYWYIDEYKLYEQLNTLIIKEELENNEYSINMFILDDDLTIFNEYNEDERCVNLTVSIINNLPNELDKYLGFRCFSNINYKDSLGNKYIDNIKPLSPLDKDELLVFCDELMKQGHISKCEAISFKMYFDMYLENPNIETKILGVFLDNNIVGVLTYSVFETYGMIEDIGVLESFSKMGIGKALCESVLKANQDIKFLYQSAKQNIASISLAKSLGFDFIGARELYVKAKE